MAVGWKKRYVLWVSLRSGLSADTIIIIQENTKTFSMHVFCLHVRICSWLLCLLLLLLIIIAVIQLRSS